MLYVVQKNRIKEMREKAGISSYRLSKELGYTGNAYLWNIEHGNKIPGVEVAYSIAKTLGCTIDDLFVFEAK